MFDIAAIVVVLVLFSALLIDPNSQMIAPSTSIHTRNIYLGFLYAAYPATQFLGAPILGELSDRLGRKIIINVSTLGTVAAFFLTASSILYLNLPLLFLSRLAGGFFAGNASLAQASVSNIVSKQNRSRAMALFAVAGGLSWIIGPFLGTILSNSKIVPWFGLDTPFWFLGFIFLLCWGLFMVSYQNINIKKERERLSIVQCFKNLSTIFHERIIIVPFAASLISMLGWMVVQDFFSPFLMEKFSFNTQKVGYAFAYMSVWWLIGGLFSMFIFKFKRPSTFITITTVLAAIFVLIYAIDPSPSFIFWAVAVANICFATSYSAFTALFSHLLPETMQGKLYGSWMGGFALVSAVAPAFGGWISFLGIGVPFTFGCIVILLSAGVYQAWYRKNALKLKTLKV
ncbi:MAG: hypothetical protein S4CHLAM6_05600 [Chlamydiae bacterium]|nr:hypothetical protein [Chlamydiota bacterium]